MKIAIGADHAGYELKEKIKKQLIEQGHDPKDFGTDSPDSVDYPDFGHAVAMDVENNMSALGIVVCGSGNGINMTVNKHKGIRSALCWTPELAKLARQHNNANVLALASRFTSEEDNLKIVDAFLKAEFEGGRHERRVNKITSG